MAKHGKKYLAALAKVEETVYYEPRQGAGAGERNQLRQV